MAAIESLSLAVRIPVVMRYLGELLVGIALMLGVAGGFALATGDVVFAWRAGVMLLIVGAAAWYCSKLPVASDLQVNESLVVVALTFVAGCAVMIWPLMSAGLGFSDAMFESVSGLTTTGLTTVPNPESRSEAFLFARAWMQWCGGLVIVVLALALVMEPGPVARRLFGDGAPKGTLEGTRLRARRALVIYTVLLGFGFVLLLVTGATPFDALVHSLSSVSTGGFSTHYNSIGGLDGYGQRMAVTFLTLCGAISLAAWPRNWRSWRELPRDVEFLGLLAMGLCATLLLTLTLVELDSLPWRRSLTLAPLLAFSAQTTSGFEAVPVTSLGDASKLVLIVSMLVGGSMGSTAGGFKILRFVLILRLVRYVFQRTRVTRHAVLDMESHTGAFDPRETFGMLALVFMFLIAILVSWIIFLMLGFEPMNSLFEIVSAIGTVGLSSGVSGSHLALLPKVVLCLDMLMGRLEIVAILLLVYPGTWIGKRAEIT